VDYLDKPNSGGPFSTPIRGSFSMPIDNLHLGYRSLNVNYSLNNRPAGFDVNLNGPIIAGTFRF
jgi:hypothetical protein